MNTTHYNLQLIQHLAERFELEEETVAEIINETSRHILHCLAFKGEADSPVGKLAFQQDGIQVVEQNTTLVKALREECSAEHLEKLITAVVSGY